MRWLIIQSGGEHIDNSFLRECFSIKDGLESNAQVCEIWGKRHPNFEQMPRFDQFDFIWILENYDFGWIPNLSGTKATIIQHVIDLHCVDPKHYLSMGKQSDIILHATLSLIPKYQKLLPNKKHIWFPNAISQKFFHGQSLKNDNYPKFDLVFVGSNLPQRREFINQVAKKTGMIIVYNKLGYEMIEILRSCKLGFNKSISGFDTNYRCFEHLGMGTALLSDMVPDMILLGFKDGYNFLSYHNLDECLEKIKFALKDSNWISIGRNGYRLSAFHSWDIRIRDLMIDLEIIRGVKMINHINNNGIKL